MDADLIDNAGAEDGQQDDGYNCEEGRRECEADYDGEDGQAEAGVRVVAVRCEALVALEHVDDPACVEQGRYRLDNVVEHLHPLLVVPHQKEPHKESHGCFHQNARVEKGHVELR